MFMFFSTIRGSKYSYIVLNPIRLRLDVFGVPGQGLGRGKGGGGVGGVGFKSPSSLHKPETVVAIVMKLEG